MATPANELAALLQEFEAAVRSTGCPYFDYAAPGATMADIEAAFGALNLPPVPDAVTLFSWHNGMTPGARTQPLPTALMLMSLDISVSLYGILDPESERPEWFPIISYTHAAAIGMDTSRVSATGSSPVAHMDAQYGWDDEVSSLAVPVSWWISYLRDGTWRWSGDRWDKEVDRDALSDEQRKASMLF